MGSTIIIFRESISRAFTNVPGVYNYLSFMIPISGVLVLPYSGFITLATILRVLRKSKELAWMYIAPMFIILVGGGYVLMFWTNYNKGCLM